MSQNCKDGHEVIEITKVVSVYFLSCLQLFKAAKIKTW